MRAMQLLENVQFNPDRGNAEPLLVNRFGRILRFSLKAGQSIEEHNAGDSPLWIVILQGTGFFTGGDGREQPVQPASLLLFDPGENHSVRAGGEELVFVAFFAPVPVIREDHEGGTLGRERN